MTNQMKAAMATMLMVGSVSLHAQTSTTATPAKKTSTSKKKVVESSTTREMRELREKQAAQQIEIDRLTQQLSAKDAALTTAQQSAQTATDAAQAATAQAQAVTATVQANTDAVQALKSNVVDLQTTNTGLATTISANKQELTEKIESPIAIHFKGVTLTPMGFVAGETVTRTRSIDSDINTPFSSTPYMNSAQAYTSETNFSGRQSRLGLTVSAPTPFGKMGGYYEIDFLGAGVTSNDNQTNSYVVRQREAWGQISTNTGFSLTAGQMWSLATEVKKGITEVSGAENLPMGVDAQYHVGFSFERQYGARFAQSLGTKQNVAFSVEESQTVLVGSNLPSNFFLGADGNTGGLYNSTGNGSVGAGGGAQNYTNNPAPDVIVKYTADPGFGHFEVGGIARFFRDRVYPQTTGYTTAVSTTAATGSNVTTLGGGFFVNARVKATHYLDLGVHILQGDGMGRYGTSNLGDVTARPDGRLEPLRSSQGLLSIETHPTKKLDVFGYAGGEYLQRTVYTAYTAAAPTTPVLVGYAPNNLQLSACGTEIPPSANTGYAPGSSPCSPATRAVLEGTGGFIYRIYSNPSKGRFQYEMQYSFLEKSAWTGINVHDVGGYGSPKATNNMIFTSFRYYLP